jgi:hypothetical protein
MLTLNVGKYRRNQEIKKGEGFSYGLASAHVQGFLMKM